jgi:hypothetical protein
MRTILACHRQRCMPAEIGRRTSLRLMWNERLLGSLVTVLYVVVNRRPARRWARATALFWGFVPPVGLGHGHARDLRIHRWQCGVRATATRSVSLGGVAEGITLCARGAYDNHAASHRGLRICTGIRERSLSRRRRTLQRAWWPRPLATDCVRDGCEFSGIPGFAREPRNRRGGGLS